MHKEIRVVYMESAKEELLGILDKLEIEKYMNFEGIQAQWAKHIRHLNTHVWPGTENILMLILEENKAEELLRELRKFKESLIEGVMLYVIVTDIADIF